MVKSFALSIHGEISFSGIQRLISSGDFREVGHRCAIVCSKRVADNHSKSY